MLRFRCPSCRNMLVLDGALDFEEVLTCPGCQKPCRLPRSLRPQPPEQVHKGADEDALDVVAADAAQPATGSHQRDETAADDVLEVVEDVLEEIEDEADREPRSSRRGDSQMRRRAQEEDERRSRSRYEDEDERDRPRRRYDDDYDDRPRSRRSRDDRDDYDDRPRSRRDRDDYDDRSRRRDEYDDYDYEADADAGKLTVVDRMYRVHLGLGFHYAMLFCILLADNLLNFALFVPLFTIYAFILCLLAPVLGLVGSLICCHTPRKSKARPMALTSFILDCVACLLVLGGIFIYLLSDAEVGWILAALGVVVTLVAFILFLSFLGRLATYLRDGAQSREASEITLKWVILMVLLLLPTSFILIGLSKNSRVIFWMGIFFLVSWDAMIARLLLALFHLIGSLRYRIASRF